MDKYEFRLRLKQCASAGEVERLLLNDWAGVKNSAPDEGQLLLDEAMLRMDQLEAALPQAA